MKIVTEIKFKLKDLKYTSYTQSKEQNAMYIKCLKIGHKIFRYSQNIGDIFVHYN